LPCWGVNKRQCRSVVNPPVDWLGELENGLGAIKRVTRFSGDAGGVLHVRRHLVSRIYAVVQNHVGESPLTSAEVMLTAVPFCGVDP